MELPRLGAALIAVASAAAVDRLAATVPAGEMWLLIDAVASHDDPVAKTLFWVIEGEAGMTQVLDEGATGANVRVRLGDGYAMPFWMPPTWSVRIQSTVALAAGKKFYMSYHVHKLRGVPPGSYL